VAVYVFFFDILPMFPQHLGQMGGKRKKFYHSNFNIEKEKVGESRTRRITRRSKFEKRKYFLRLEKKSHISLKIHNFTNNEI